MVFNETGERGRGEEMVLANPEIVAWSKDTLFEEEGCLSFPRIYGQVEVGARLGCDGALVTIGVDAFKHALPAPLLQRPRAVRVRYQDETGAAKELELMGWPARVFQHEFDHLQVRLRCPRGLLLAAGQPGARGSQRCSPACGGDMAVCEACCPAAARLARAGILQGQQNRFQALDRLHYLAP